MYLGWGGGNTGRAEGQDRLGRERREGAQKGRERRSSKERQHLKGLGETRGKGEPRTDRRSILSPILTQVEFSVFQEI